MQEHKDYERTFANHPLFQKPIRPWSNWREWCERWQAAVSYQEMIGLLHTGFDASPDYHDGTYDRDRAERILMYFDIADSWNDSLSLYAPGEHSGFAENKFLFGYTESGQNILKSAAELRQLIARKAFDVLATNFFVNTGDSESPYAVWQSRLLFSRRIFLRLQEFFQSGNRIAESHCIRNLSASFRKDRSHTERLAIEFLTHLAKHVFTSSDDTVESWVTNREEVLAAQEARRELMNKAKPWLIEVMLYVGREHYLRDWFRTFDKDCLLKLKEIAFRSELLQFVHPINDTRPVQSIEEAVYSGSRAARLLLDFELYERVHTRLEQTRQSELRKKNK